MALLFSSAITSGTTPMAVELPDNYVFNGQLYDKYSLAPIPLKFFNDLTGNNNAPMFKRNVHLATYFTYTKQLNQWEVDNNDPNITYMTTYANAQSVIKVIKKNNNFVVDKQVNLVAFSYEYGDFRCEIIDQDDNYIYVLKNPSDSGSTSYYYSHVQVFKLSKTDLSIVNRLDFYNYAERGKLLYKDAQYLYIYVTSFHTSGTNYNPGIYKLKKFDMSLTTLVSYSKDTAITSLPTNLIKFDAVTNTNIYYTVNSVGNVLGVKKIMIDINNTTASLADVACYEIIGGVEQSIIITDVPDFNDYYETVYHIDPNNNQEYITMYRMCTNVNYPNRTTTKFFVFKMMADGRLKLVQKQTFPMTVVGMLEFDNNLSIILFGRTFVKSFYWNTDKEKYELIDELNDDFTMIAADENDNLWTFSSITKALNVYSQYVPMTINAEFELENYDYNGIPIDSYVSYYTRNFGGKYIQTIIEMTLDGPCVFTENGKKVITKVTSPTSKLNIPVQVTGKGVLRVGIRLLQG